MIRQISRLWFFATFFALFQQMMKRGRWQSVANRHKKLKRADLNATRLRAVTFQCKAKNFDIYPICSLCVNSCLVSSGNRLIIFLRIYKWLASSSYAFLWALKLTIATIMMNPHIFVMHVVLNKHFMFLLVFNNGPYREGHSYQDLLWHYLLDEVVML